MGMHSRVSRYTQITGFNCFHIDFSSRHTALAAGCTGIVERFERHLPEKDPGGRKRACRWGVAPTFEKRAAWRRATSPFQVLWVERKKPGGLSRGILMSVSGKFHLLPNSPGRSARTWRVDRTAKEFKHRHLFSTFACGLMRFPGSNGSKKDALHAVLTWVV